MQKPLIAAFVLVAGGMPFAMTACGSSFADASGATETSDAAPTVDAGAADATTDSTDAAFALDALAASEAGTPDAAGSDGSDTNDDGGPPVVPSGCLEAGAPPHQLFVDSAHGTDAVGFGIGASECAFKTIDFALAQYTAQGMIDGTVRVAAGDYAPTDAGAGGASSFQLPDRITLGCDGSHGTILHATTGDPVLQISGKQVLVSSCTVSCTSVTRSLGAEVTNEHAELDGVQFQGCQTGVQIDATSLGPILRSNTFSAAGGVDIAITGAVDVTVNANVFYESAVPITCTAVGSSGPQLAGVGNVDEDQNGMELGCPAGCTCATTSGGL